MNIVHICPRPFPSLGGPAKNYQQFQQAMGGDTIAWVAAHDGIGEEPVLSLAEIIRTVGGRTLGQYYYAPAARLRNVERLVSGADMVFFHGLYTYPLVAVSRMCWRYGVPYGIALHGILDPWARRKRRIVKGTWMRLYGWKILRRASALLCTTQREADKVAPYLRDAGPRRVVSWAQELPDLGKILGRRAELRRELGFGADDRVLVFFGRLHSMKRPQETVRLAAKHGGSRVKLLMIGPDDDVTKKQLEADARELGWAGLRVVGPVFGDRKYELLGAGDAYISWSYRENFNYSLTEAMAAGLPPILSRGNDLGWEFADEGFSWQMHTDEVAEAGAAIEAFSLLSDLQLRERGDAARRWTEQHLSIDRFRHELEAIVREAGGRRKIS